MVLNGRIESQMRTHKRRNTGVVENNVLKYLRKDGCHQLRPASNRSRTIGTREPPELQACMGGGKGG